MKFTWIYAALYLLPGVSCIDGWFWHVTDIHYDNTYDGRRLSCYEYANITNPGLYGDYKCDSPWSLVDRSIQAMVDIRPNVDFILWTGDTVLHAPISELNNAKVIEIIENVTEALKSAFPGMPIYATFGNHDYNPHDQFPTHSNQVYNATLQQWISWISDTTQDEPFMRGGYYTVRTQHGLRIIGLNTNLFYIRNRQISNTTDPAGQLYWLNKTLAEAQQRHEKVVVTAHIPFGIETPSGRLSMYEKFHKPFVSLLQVYADIIVGIHFGHQHADSFKVVTNTNGLPGTPVFIAPSLTPALNHNPAIRLVKYDRQTGKHLGMEQYFLDLKKANHNISLSWSLEYRASEAYNLPDMTAASLTELTKRMKEPESREFQKYWKYNRVSLPVELQRNCNRSCHASMICGITELYRDSFDNCVQDILTSASSELQTSLLNVLATIFSVFLVSC